jgi:hypothetical protein
MKKNHKMITIGIIILFVGCYFGSVTASELPEGKPQDEGLILECGRINLDGTTTAEKFPLSEQELAELEITLSKLMEELESAINPDDVENIIESALTTEGSFGLKHPVLAWILNSLSSYKLPRSRAFVASHGRSFKINPFKNHRSDTYRPLTLWQYSDKWGFDRPGKTFILRYSPFNTKILHGRQIGMMTHFFGIYVYVSQPPPQKSYTFFIGSARHVGGIDFTYSSSFAWIFPLPPSSNNPIRPTADFSFYPIELTTDNIIHFSDKSTDEDGIIEFWSWDFGDEHNSVKQNPQHQYITSGTYTVSLEITDSDGNTNSISKAIIIRDPPTVEEDSRDDNTHGDKDVGGTLNFGILIALISIIAVAAYMWKRK